MCEACTSDAACVTAYGPQHLCIGNACVPGQCRVSSDCAGGQICDAPTRTCNACGSDTACSVDPSYGSSTVCIGGRLRPRRLPRHAAATARPASCAASRRPTPAAAVRPTRSARPIRDTARATSASRASASPATATAPAPTARARCPATCAARRARTPAARARPTRSARPIRPTARRRSATRRPASRTAANASARRAAPAARARPTPATSAAAALCTPGNCCVDADCAPLGAVYRCVNNSCTGCAPATGNKYYVDPVNGSDASATGSGMVGGVANPSCSFRTVTHALQVVGGFAVAGTQIIVVGQSGQTRVARRERDACRSSCRRTSPSRRRTGRSASNLPASSDPNLGNVGGLPAGRRSGGDRARSGGADHHRRRIAELRHRHRRVARRRQVGVAVVRDRAEHGRPRHRGVERHARHRPGRHRRRARGRRSSAATASTSAAAW